MLDTKEIIKDPKKVNGKAKDFIVNPIGFEWLQRNDRPEKPRKVGMTEIRAAYYSNFGLSYFKDILETTGNYVDSIKFAGGSFTFMNPEKIKATNKLAHDYGVLSSTGGFMEYVLTKGKDAVKRYIQECKELGFDIIEISTGLISIPTDDWLRVIEEVQKAGLKAKPEIGVQFGAGGDGTIAEYEAEGIQDVEYATNQAKRFLDAGAYIIMMESEGVTENANPWKVNVPAKFIRELGLENVMFEAADPQVFKWYIKNYGPEVNLFVDHSQIVQLEATRQGIWGTNDVWGRIVTYK
ncbi:phosphosulfolactate synthase [Aequorivita sp. H23M31]|uniref:Phosphosulfolactate synthase n=1 Tax=Aequorivita ciconiae TaxID=2494375 RepID=A0A410G1F4_9FLAO|nr:phosphosulfolactate synthase [Aequorivita sp. H23M31]QAA81075.1 phosphosulfolactate synthase [Aequorivita sp. H23M31]